MASDTVIEQLAALAASRKHHIVQQDDYLIQLEPSIEVIVSLAGSKESLLAGITQKLHDDHYKSQHEFVAVLCVAMAAILRCEYGVTPVGHVSGITVCSNSMDVLTKDISLDSMQSMIRSLRNVQHTGAAWSLFVHLAGVCQQLILSDRSDGIALLKTLLQIVMIQLQDLLLQLLYETKAPVSKSKVLSQPKRGAHKSRSSIFNIRLTSSQRALIRTIGESSGTLAHIFGTIPSTATHEMYRQFYTCLSEALSELIPLCFVYPSEEVRGICCSVTREWLDACSPIDEVPVESKCTVTYQQALQLIQSCLLTTLSDHLHDMLQEIKTPVIIEISQCAAQCSPEMVMYLREEALGALITFHAHISSPFFSDFTNHSSENSLESLFWNAVRDGILSADLTTRKRALHLLKHATVNSMQSAYHDQWSLYCTLLDTCEEQALHLVLDVWSRIENLFTGSEHRATKDPLRLHQADQTTPPNTVPDFEYPKESHPVPWYWIQLLFHRALNVELVTIRKNLLLKLLDIPSAWLHSQWPDLAIREQQQQHAIATCFGGESKLSSATMDHTKASTSVTTPLALRLPISFVADTLLGFISDSALYKGTQGGVYGHLMRFYIAYYASLSTQRGLFFQLFIRAFRKHTHVCRFSLRLCLELIQEFHACDCNHIPAWLLDHNGLGTVGYGGLMPERAYADASLDQPFHINTFQISSLPKLSHVLDSSFFQDFIEIREIICDAQLKTHFTRALRSLLVLVVRYTNVTSFSFEQITQLLAMFPLAFAGPYDISIASSSCEIKEICLSRAKVNTNSRTSNWCALLWWRFGLSLEDDDDSRDSSCLASPINFSHELQRCIDQKNIADSMNRNADAYIPSVHGIARLCSMFPLDVLPTILRPITKTLGVFTCSRSYASREPLQYSIELLSEILFTAWDAPIALKRLASILCDDNVPGLLCSITRQSSFDANDKFILSIAEPEFMLFINFLRRLGRCLLCVEQDGLHLSPQLRTTLISTTTEIVSGAVQTLVDCDREFAGDDCESALFVISRLLILCEHTLYPSADSDLSQSGSIFSFNAIVQALESVDRLSKCIDQEQTLSPRDAEKSIAAAATAMVWHAFASVARAIVRYANSSDALESHYQPIALKLCRCAQNALLTIRTSAPVGRRNFASHPHMYALASLQPCARVLACCLPLLSVWESKFADNSLDLLWKCFSLRSQWSEKAWLWLTHSICRPEFMVNALRHQSDSLIPPKDTLAANCVRTMNSIVKRCSSSGIAAAMQAVGIALTTMLTHVISTLVQIHSESKTPLPLVTQLSTLFTWWCPTLVALITFREPVSPGEISSLVDKSSRLELLERLRARSLRKRNDTGASAITQMWASKLERFVDTLWNRPASIESIGGPESNFVAQQQIAADAHELFDSEPISLSGHQHISYIPYNADVCLPDITTESFDDRTDCEHPISRQVHALNTARFTVLFFLDDLHLLLSDKNHRGAVAGVLFKALVEKLQDPALRRGSTMPGSDTHGEKLRVLQGLLVLHRYLEDPTIAQNAISYLLAALLEVELPSSRHYLELLSISMLECWPESIVENSCGMSLVMLLQDLNLKQMPAFSAVRVASRLCVTLARRVRNSKIVSSSSEICETTSDVPMNHGIVTGLNVNASSRMYKRARTDTSKYTGETATELLSRLKALYQALLPWVCANTTAIRTLAQIAILEAADILGFGNYSLTPTKAGDEQLPECTSQIHTSDSYLTKSLLHTLFHSLHQSDVVRSMIKRYAFILDNNEAHSQSTLEAVITSCVSDTGELLPLELFSALKHAHKASMFAVAEVDPHEAAMASTGSRHDPRLRTCDELSWLVSAGLSPSIHAERELELLADALSYKSSTDDKVDSLGDVASLHHFIRSKLASERSTELPHLKNKDNIQEESAASGFIERLDNNNAHQSPLDRKQDPQSLSTFNIQRKVQPWATETLGAGARTTLGQGRADFQHANCINGDHNTGTWERHSIPRTIKSDERDPKRTVLNRADTLSGRFHQPVIMCAALVDKAPNLGGLARTCEIFGAEGLCVPDRSIISHDAFRSVSVTAANWLPILEVKPAHLKEYLQLKRREGYTIVGLEQAARSQALGRVALPEKIVLVLGKEKQGIPVEIIQELDLCVEIPQLGVLRSLNVHVSGAMLLWDYTRQRLDNALDQHAQL